MKAAIFFATFVITVFSNQAEAATLEDVSPHFSKDIPIIWKASTNGLPAKLWIYWKQPHTFSPAIISNGIVLASLQNHKIPLSPTNEVCIDLDSCPCGHPCTFQISPKSGLLCFASPGYRNGSPIGLPTDREVAKRAWECARLLGVNPGQLSQKNITTNHCEYDLRGGLSSNNPCGRNIVLARRIDGVDFQTGGEEGFSIELGSQGMIRFFSLTWPDLMKDKAHPLATPAQIIACIRAAKTPILPEDGEPDYLGRIKNFSKATRLTITKITPYYAEGIYGEMPKDNDMPQFVNPIAELEAVAEIGKTNVQIRLYSPIITSDVNRLLMKNEKIPGHP